MADGDYERREQRERDLARLRRRLQELKSEKVKELKSFSPLNAQKSN